MGPGVDSSAMDLRVYCGSVTLLPLGSENLRMKRSTFSRMRASMTGDRDSLDRAKESQRNSWEHIMLMLYFETYHPGTGLRILVT
jgi:hypothetical protein